MRKQDVLILGLSSIVTRRVLPALLGLEGVGAIHVASRRPVDPSLIPPERTGSTWTDYASALRECEPCLAYISLPNTLHAMWVRQALMQGFHVIVDKPAVVGDFSEAEALAELALSTSKVFAEATVWPWHPLAEELGALARRADAGSLAALVTFTSPPMDASNFRYSKALGGGVILDRASYAVSCGRVLFGQAPTEVWCSILGAAEGPDGVDLSFSTTLKYPKGVLLGFFSLESEYQNKVELIGEGFAGSTERIFTPPADFEGTTTVRERGRVTELRSPAADSFAGFVESVLDAIAADDFETHSSILREDAQVMERLWAAVKEGEK